MRVPILQDFWSGDPGRGGPAEKPTLRVARSSRAADQPRANILEGRHDEQAAALRDRHPTRPRAATANATRVPELATVTGHLPDEAMRKRMIAHLDTK